MAKNAAVQKPLESSSTLNRLPHLAESSYSRPPDARFHAVI